MLEEYEKAKELVQAFEHWKVVKANTNDPYSFDNFIKEQLVIRKAEIYDIVYDFAAADGGFESDTDVGAYFRVHTGLIK